jgi:hypothetical protein
MSTISSISRMTPLERNYVGVQMDLSFVYCGSKLVTHSIQRRSADEGQTLETMCTSCILDMEMVMNASSNTRVLYTTPVELPVYQQPSYGCFPQPMSGILLNSVCKLEFELSTSPSNAEELWLSRCNRHGVIEGVSYVQTRVVTLEGIDLSAITSKRVVFGVEDEIVTKVIVSNTIVAPGVSFKCSREWSVSWGRTNGDEDIYVDGYKKITYPGPGGTVFCMTMVGDDHYSLDMELIDERDFECDLMLGFLESFLFACGYSRGKDYERKSRRIIRDITSRAYDSPVPDTSKESLYYYVGKVDRERCVMYLEGCVWTIYRSGKSRRVLGYLVASVPRELGKRSWILDVEITREGTLVMIDILAGLSGIILTTGRNMDSMMRMLDSLLIDIPCVYIRLYHLSYSECVSSLDTIPFECEGVMAVSKDSMACLKLKPSRSIELEVVTDDTHVMKLCTRDGVCMYTYESLGFAVGDIVEVRIEINPNTHDALVTCLTLKADKSRAIPVKDVKRIHSVDACSVHAAGMKEESVTDKCFSIRSFIYGFRIVPTGSKRILMEGGCGRGQSYNMMLERSQFGIYILIEPNMECAVAVAHLSNSTVCTNAEDVSRIAKGIRNCDKDMVVIAMLLEDVWKVEEMKLLITCNVGLVTCSFSFNYVMSTLKLMWMACRVPIVGSCYVYDGVDSLGVLIDTDIAKMSVVKGCSSMAKVRWGNEHYTEPRLDTKNILELGVFGVTRCFQHFPIVEHIRVVYSVNVRHLVAHPTLHLYSNEDFSLQ